ncbi:F0F1 ATP synthase subunit B [bacterium]|nr:F0F1 ATP synthase subunit B [bacterium]
MNINLPTIILQAIAFLTLMFILKKLLYKPILDLLDKRIESTNNLIDKTEKKNKEAEKVLLEAKTEFENAKKEALNIRDLAKRAGLKERETIIEQSKQEAQFVLSKTREEIKAEAESTKHELKSYIADFAIKISEKLLLREMNQEDRKRYIKLYLKEIEEKK